MVKINLQQLADNYVMQKTNSDQLAIKIWGVVLIVSIILLVVGTMLYLKTFHELASEMIIACSVIGMILAIIFIANACVDLYSIKRYDSITSYLQSINRRY